MNRVIFLFSFFTFLNVAAQQDYKWFKINSFKVATLSDSLKETSGLNFHDGKLYTFNDGGNTSEIFEIDKFSGKIQKKLETGLKNFDWEALTSDDNYFYVGEFGNNMGNRTDLKIYRINKDNSTEFSEIKYRYPEQTDYSKQGHRHNFDAESMIHKDGNLHIFTKEWQSYHTTHYRLSANSSTEIEDAEKLEVFNLGYMATDASYFDKRLYILGYTKKLEVFLTVFEEDEKGLFFNRKPKKFYLGSSSRLGQIEGIAVNGDGMYISGESFTYKIFNAQQSLYFIPKEKMNF